MHDGASDVNADPRLANAGTRRISRPQGLGRSSVSPLTVAGIDIGATGIRVGVDADGEPQILVEQVYGHGSPASRLAAFAPAVAHAARAGDPIAAGIWREAATRLAEAVSAVASAVEPLISWGGRLLDRLDRARFERTRG